MFRCGSFTVDWTDLSKLVDELVTDYNNEVRPADDVKTSESGSTIELALPGVPQEQIHAKARDKGSYQEVEIFGTGRNKEQFKKIYNFHDHDIEKINAIYTDGLLRIEIPKTVGKARDIPIWKK